jgi:Ca2+/Na+ antiporter
MENGKNGTQSIPLYVFFLHKLFVAINMPHSNLLKVYMHKAFCGASFLLSIGIMVSIALVILAVALNAPVQVLKLSTIFFSGLIIDSILLLATQILCDNWLVPWIAQAQVLMNMSDDLAGVSIVALGSSLPEIMISTIAVFDGKAKIAFSFLLGCSIIGFGAIPAMCFFQ